MALHRPFILWILWRSTHSSLGGNNVTEGGKDVKKARCLRVCLSAICHDSDGVLDTLVGRSIGIETGELIGEDDKRSCEEEVGDKGISLLEITALEGILNQDDGMRRGDHAGFGEFVHFASSSGFSVTWGPFGFLGFRVEQIEEERSGE